MYVYRDFLGGIHMLNFTKCAKQLLSIILWIFCCNTALMTTVERTHIGQLK